MTVILIIGAHGQDGRIACELFKERGHEVYGIGKFSGLFRYNESVYDPNVSISNPLSITNAIKRLRPDEIYYFAAFSQSSEERHLVSSETFHYSQEVHVTGLFHILETMRISLPNTKLLYASSSLIFEGSDSVYQNEETLPAPKSVYAITKITGQMLCSYYRKIHGLFASVAILFNHESEYRDKKYLSMKIILTAILIKNGKADKLVIGDSLAKVDWGYARDYVEAMYMANQLKNSDDYIIATGELHTVAEFVELVFNNLNLDYKNYVVENNTLIKSNRQYFCGDSSKLRKHTGWEPKTSFTEMINKITYIKLNEIMK